MLAGVSVDYYTRLERGNLGGVSDLVLEGLARALRLDEAERAHLFDLARSTATTRRPRRRSADRIRPSVQRILDALTDAPAVVRNARMDLLAWNDLGGALYAPMVIDPIPGPRNTARFVFLDPRSRTYFPDWDMSAHDVVAVLRGEAGRDPCDRALSDLIGELSTRSPEFASRWAAHDVRFHRAGTKTIAHPVVGTLILDYDALVLPADPGLTLLVYTAEAGSRTARNLALLGSWAATAAPDTAPRSTPDTA